MIFAKKQTICRDRACPVPTNGMEEILYNYYMIYFTKIVKESPTK